MINPLVSNHMEALSEYMIFTKYAKYDPKKKRRETWNETVSRSCDMHLQRYGSKGIDKDINWAFDMVRQKRVLPSMRSMQFGGDAIIANDARMYNCSFSLADRIRFFQETLWLLLSGCGVGFSVQKQHVDKLPELIDHVDSSEKSIMTYNVADSIEGWADALGILMNSYFKDTEISGREVFFDFTRIRRKGSWLKTSGGRAPGPKPLQTALKRIKKILRDAVESGCKKLSTIQAYDIVMVASDCVLAGGIRRSACLAMFSKDDQDMMVAKSFSTRGKVLSNKNKDGIWNTELGEAYYLTNDSGAEAVAGDVVTITWYNLSPWRARSNNSVTLLRNDTKFEDFNAIIENAKKFGEPGFLFVENLDYGFNPCLTGDMKLLTKNGYNTLSNLWVKGGCQQYNQSKSIDNYGKIDIVNSNGVVKATNIYRTSESAPIYKISFTDGSYIKSTLNHSFYIIENNVKIKKKLSELNIGDSIPQNREECFGEFNDVDYGLLAGWVCGDGSLCGDKSIGRKSTKHNVPNNIWGANKNTVAAFLRGLFSCDGSMQLSEVKKYISVRLAQSNESFLQQIKLLLNLFGITSTICKRGDERELLMNDGEFGKKLYKVKAKYELIIGGINNVRNYIDNIGFIQQYKYKHLLWLNEHNGSNNSQVQYITKVQSIEYIGDEPTYCLTEFVNNEIVINGLVIGQCAEINLNPIDPKTGKTGWAFCNLAEINGAKIKTKEDFRQAVRAATIIGTLQAGYTYLHYLKDASRNIIRREALLGVSLTGWMDNAPLLLDQETQKEMALYAVEVNKEYAKKIGIEPAARVTTTKPSGSTSLVLGTGSGIHPQHSRRYFRRVQAAIVEKPLQYFKAHNPHMVEKSQWGKNDEIITFCVEVPETALVKKDISAIKFLEIVKNTYLNWVVPGTARPDSSPGAVHNVSNTVTVGDDEWDAVAKFIYENRKCFSGISLLPKKGDKIYKQAPLEAVESEEDIKKWNDMVSNYVPVDWTLFEEMDDNTTRQNEISCHGVVCDANLTI